MAFLNKLNSARVGKIFARWHLAIAITSIITLEYGYVSAEVTNERLCHITKTVVFV